MEIALTLDSVSKNFGDFKAVDDVSFEIPAGIICGFLGPNGAGKTTTIRMILEILRPSAGSITVLGAPSALEVRDRIGYLPEEKGLYKKMTAVGIITYFATLKGMRTSTARKKARALLEQYGLGDFADSKCEALSKGMSQKVQVLASMVHDPEFVILDEPFSGLDPVNQQVMEEVIRDMRKRGATVIFSTHVMSHAERICERILLMAKGKIIFDGSIADARRTIPRRVLISTDASIEALLGVEGVLGSRRPDGEEDSGSWEILIDDDLDPQELLRSAFDNGIALESFQHSEPTLHDVFVHLVGDDAKIAEAR
ncbi:MAG TPA: ATP-binding cassette domain-containing protein [Planctomycetes bacterium]|nr:ATP-binding cassette domain-containing protein [Planctomycetota bacterium]HIN81219.1 ATP-binding cassette domain-containing protein [Planctomycetota bacterium]